MNVQTIQVALIDPPLFNSRLAGNEGYSAESLKLLGESLRGQQLQAVIVRQTNEGTRYRLIAGSRRVAAAKTVGLETVVADVIMHDLTEAEEALLNGVENSQRKDLTTYELARLCAELRKRGLKGKDVAEQLGISIQHASNLAICFEKLPEVIHVGWRQGVSGTDVTFLRSIITKKDNDGKTVDATSSEMVAAYNERRASLESVNGDEEEDEEEDEEDESETAGAPAPKKFTVSKERYRTLLKALRAAKAPQVAVDAARYLVGDIEKIRGITMGDAPKTTNGKGK